MGWADAPEDSMLFFRCRCFLGAPVKKGRWEPLVVKPWRPSWAFWSPRGRRAALLGQSERRLPFSALSGLFTLVEPVPSLGWAGVPGVETGTIVSYCQLLWDLLLFSWVLLFPFWLHCHWDEVFFIRFLRPSWLDLQCVHWPVNNKGVRHGGKTEISSSF